MQTHPATLVGEVLDREIVHGKREFLFPADKFSENDLIVREVASRIGCNDITLGMSAISKIDRRTKVWKSLFQNSPVVRCFDAQNIKLPKNWFVARI